jgi:hypothetical protein
MLQKQLADYATVPDAQQAEPATEDKSRGEPASFAGGVPSREGMGTLPGSPSTVVDFETFRRKKQEGGAA